MSPVGNSLANRPIEYFWSIIKYECIYNIPYHERTKERIIKEIEKFIKFYNEYRQQTYLNNKTPNEFFIEPILLPYSQRFDFLKMKQKTEKDNSL